MLEIGEGYATYNAGRDFLLSLGTSARSQKNIFNVNVGHVAYKKRA